MNREVVNGGREFNIAFIKSRYSVLYEQCKAKGDMAFFLLPPYAHIQLSEELGVSLLTIRQYLREIRGRKTVTQYRRERRSAMARGEVVGTGNSQRVAELAFLYEHFPMLAVRHQFSEVMGLPVFYRRGRRKGEKKEHLVPEQRALRALRKQYEAGVRIVPLSKERIQELSRKAKEVLNKE